MTDDYLTLSDSTNPEHQAIVATLAKAQALKIKVSRTLPPRGLNNADSSIGTIWLQVGYRPKFSDAEYIPEGETRIPHARAFILFHVSPSGEPWWLLLDGFALRPSRWIDPEDPAFDNRDWDPRREVQA